MVRGRSMDAVSALDARPGHAFRQRYGDRLHACAPRAGFLLALTRDGKTLLKGGAGMFYDRVPLMIPIFEKLPVEQCPCLTPTGKSSKLNLLSESAYRRASESAKHFVERCAREAGPGIAYAPRRL